MATSSLNWHSVAGVQSPQPISITQRVMDEG
jgi:hypothetical protein